MNSDIIDEEIEELEEVFQIMTDRAKIIIILNL